MGNPNPTAAAATTTAASPIEQILNTIRNLNAVSRDIVFGGGGGTTGAQ
jgi:hypothetical protein